MTAYVVFVIIILFIILIFGIINPKVKLKKPTRLKLVVFWFLTLVVFVLIGISFQSIKNDKGKNDLKNAINLIEKGEFSKSIQILNNINVDSPYFTEAVALVQTADSLNKIAKEEELIELQLKAEKSKLDELAKQKERFELEIESINKGFDSSIYRGSIEGLILEVELFESWAKLINRGLETDDLEVQKLAKQLKIKVSNIQKNEFPKIRKEYTEIVAKKMWENDIDVSSSGTGNKYINFTGAIFAANKNKKDFHTELHEILYSFRFNQARYKWFDGATEYTYWTIYEGSDSDL